MKIGIVSGKGGAGKTLVAVNLANMASMNNTTTLFDLDVEEPNTFLFFTKQKELVENVYQMIPIVDESNCGFCGVCARVCRFNAIVNLGSKIIVSQDLCKSCYTCLELCPRNAISEGIKEIGKIRTIDSSNLKLVEGRMKVSESSAPELIRAVKKKLDKDSKINIYDSPPGTACSVVESLKDIDYAVIVAEPTLFGFHDFQLIVELTKSLNKEFGVVINKYNKENTRLENYCRENNINIIGKINYSNSIAKAYAHGELLNPNDEEINSSFIQILNTIIEKTEENIYE